MHLVRLGAVVAAFARDDRVLLRHCEGGRRVRDEGRKGVPTIAWDLGARTLEFWGAARADAPRTSTRGSRPHRAHPRRGVGVHEHAPDDGLVEAELHVRARGSAFVTSAAVRGPSSASSRTPRTGMRAPRRTPWRGHRRGGVEGAAGPHARGFPRVGKRRKIAVFSHQNLAPEVKNFLKLLTRRTAFVLRRFFKRSSVSSPRPALRS